MASKRVGGDVVAMLKRRAGPKSGNVRVMIYMPPEQLAALTAEARRRADERGAVRADVSAVVVEAIGSWLKAKR